MYICINIQTFDFQLCIFKMSSCDESKSHHLTIREIVIGDETFQVEKVYKIYWCKYYIQHICFILYSIHKIEYHFKN